MDTARPEELDRLRAEVAEWRRRAEVAEAVSTERLARAETAEKALAATEAALRTSEPAATAVRGLPLDGPPARSPAPGEDEPAAPENPARPRSLRERWRRYIDSVN